MLAMVLTGCSDLVKVAEPQAVTITWVRAKPTECGDAKNALGCAVTSPTYNARDCLIIMAEDSPDWVVAHEFRHCFGFKHG